MRRQITLLVAATTSIVLLAFLLPAASLVARVAEARAMDAAQAQLQFLLPSVGLDDEDQVAANLGGLTGGTQVGVLWTDGTTWLGARGTTVTPPGSPEVVESDDGRRLVQPVDRQGGTAVVEIFVPTELLRAGRPHLGRAGGAGRRPAAAGARRRRPAGAVDDPAGDRPGGDRAPAR